MFGKKVPPQHEKPKEDVTFDGLLQQVSALNAQIATRRDAEIEALKLKVNAVCVALGTTVAQLFGIQTEKRERKKRVVRPKFRHPKTGEEWSGRGRPPAWMQEMLSNGADKGDFLIERTHD